MLVALASTNTGTSTSKYAHEYSIGLLAERVVRPDDDTRYTEQHVGTIEKATVRIGS